MIDNPQYSIEYLQYCLEELETYLLASELFWPVSVYPAQANHSYPRMTLGNMLLFLHYLEGLSQSRKLSPTEETQYRELKTKIEDLQNKWTVAWEKKAAHEFRSRFNQWTNYLNELKDKPGVSAIYYASEVRVRVLLELLRNHIPEDELLDLGPLDAYIRVLLAPAHFLWDKAVAPGFPRDTFWFLYGQIELEN